MTALLVLAGGAVGALVRYFVERRAVRSFGERVPWGTGLVNLLGALLLGLLVALHARGALPDAVLALLGTGFCGALTTFSGFVGQVESRIRHRASRATALTYLGASVGLGLLFAWAGQAVGRG